MTAQQYPAWHLLSHGSKCCAKTFLIAFCASSLWWAVWPHLAERKITAKDNQPRCTEYIRQCNQERSIAVPSGAMCEHDAVPARNDGAV
jgi:hypothetical protein